MIRKLQVLNPADSWAENRSWRYGLCLRTWMMPSCVVVQLFLQSVSFSWTIQSELSAKCRWWWRQPGRLPDSLRSCSSWVKMEFSEYHLSLFIFSQMVVLCLELLRSSACYRAVQTSAVCTEQFSLFSWASLVTSGRPGCCLLSESSPLSWHGTC